MENKYKRFVEILSYPFIKLGFCPSTITILGFIISILAGLLIWSGYIFLGGILIGLAGIFDIIDGTIARTTGKTSDFGALLDSTLDRFSEAAIFLGIMGYISKEFSHSVIFYQSIVILALTGSLCVSYVRARAEGLGYNCKIGLFQRATRIVTVSIGLIINSTINNFFGLEKSNLKNLALKATLLILAVGTNTTALRRLIVCGKRMKKEK